MTHKVQITTNFNTGTVCKLVVSFTLRLFFLQKYWSLTAQREVLYTEQNVCVCWRAVAKKKFPIRN
jgi:hypothetical protein